MNDGDALLAGILAEPWNDRRRLVYADYLELQRCEPGDAELAAFIRCQVELARLTCERVVAGVRPCTDWDRTRPPSGVAEWCPACRAAVTLRAEERQLLVACGYGPHRDVDVVPGLRFPTLALLFARGFLEAMTLPAADWLAHGDAITAAHPVRRVVLTTPPRFEQVAPGEFRLIGDSTGRVLQNTPERSGIGMLEQRWPGIAFELPPAATFGGYGGGLVEAGWERSYSEHVQTMRDGLVAAIREAYTPAAAEAVRRQQEAMSHALMNAARQMQPAFRVYGQTIELAGQRLADVARELDIPWPPTAPAVTQAEWDATMADLISRDDAPTA